MKVKASLKPIVDLVLGVESSNKKETTWLLINAYPELKDNGKLSNIVVTFVDVTERENTSNALQQVHKRHTEMIANIGDVIGILDCDGTAKYISPNIEKLFGWTPKDRIGLNSLDNIHPDDLDRIQQEFTHIQSTDNATTKVEYRYRCKDESYKWIELTATNLMKDPLIQGILLNYHDITERKQVQTSLAESAKNFSEMFMEAPLGYQSLDENGMFLEVNTIWMETLGYKREEVIGKWFGDFLAPDYVEPFRKRFPIFKKNGEVHSEFEMVDKSGKHKFIAFEGRIAYKHDNKQLRTHCILQDITEQRNAELYRDLSVKILQILNEAKDFKELINDTLIEIKKATDCDATGIRIQKDSDFPYFVQHGFSDDFILTENSIQEKNPKNEICLNSDGTVSLECTCGLVISGKTDSSSPFFTKGGSFWTNDFSSFLYHSKDDEKRHNPRNKCIHEGYMSVALIPIQARGKIIGLLQINSKQKNIFTLSSVYTLEGIASHIAEAVIRMQSEAELHSEKERLAVTLRSIGDGVITTDTNCNVVMLNEAAEKLTGWSAEEAIGQPLSKVLNIVDESTDKRCDNFIANVLKTENIVEQEQHTCLISKNGKRIIIANSAAPIRDSNSVIIGVVLVFRDMTEKNKLYESMQKTQKLESLGLLAGGIAHDFNNLLGSIFGYIEMAQADNKNDSVSELLTESLNSIDRAKALTHQLLTFAKGGIPIKTTDTLFPFIQETVQFALSGSSVSSSLDIDENLWLCKFDRNQIAQVIDNLAINAQQAMPDGGIIELSAHNISFTENENPELTAGKYVKISLKDHGTGIPEKILTKIFDPYYTTKSKGQGLGLASCYSIAKKHDGCIDVQSEPGQGSTFNLYLPASSEKKAILKAKTNKKHKGSGLFLVMDDEVSIQDITKRMLESFGYTVEITQNGQEAIDFFKTAKQENKNLAGMIFDLTISGGMGGKEAITEIRKICKDTPAFVASGYSSDPIMAEPEKFGFNASISKPFMRHELATMLEETLNIK
jgi:PAS domain S-box-containing protein